MKIHSLRDELQSILKSRTLTVRQKIDNTSQIGSGLSVIILSCGPSLRDISKKTLESLRSKYLIFAVKQAHDYIDGIEDVHFINHCNLKKYRYSSATSVISSYNPLQSLRIYSKQDMILPADLDIFGKSYSDLLDHRLAVTNRYDDYLLTNTIYRPWGPGIVLELVLYFAVHIGCSAIYLAGYDLDDPFKKNLLAYKKFYEYYPQKEPAVIKQNLLKLAKKINLNVEYLRYLTNRKYNATAPMDSDENSLLVNSSRYLLPWLKSHGARISVLSDKSYVHNSIPRADINDLI